MCSEVSVNSPGNHRSTRSGACGLIWLNTGKLTRPGRCKDWRIESLYSCNSSVLCRVVGLRPKWIYTVIGPHRMRNHEQRPVGNDSVPIQLAQCWFPGLAISSAIIIIQDGSKSKLMILSEYVSKTQKIGGIWTNTNIYRENEALSDIFTWNILRHYCFMFKYSMTKSSQWNYC